MLNAVSKIVAPWFDPLGSAGDYIVEKMARGVPSRYESLFTDERKLVGRIAIVWMAAAILIQTTALNLLVPFPVRCVAGIAIGILTSVALKGRLLHHIVNCHHNLSVPVKVLLLSSIVLSVAIPVILEISGFSVFNFGLTKGLSAVLAYATAVFAFHLFISCEAFRNFDNSLEKILENDIQQLGERQHRVAYDIHKIMQFIYRHQTLRLIFLDHVKQYRPNFSIKVYSCNSEHILAQWSSKKYQVIELDAYLRRLKTFIKSHRLLWECFCDHFYQRRRDRDPLAIE